MVLDTRIDNEPNDVRTKRYRALFISDIHLGTKACQAEAFLDFLRRHALRHSWKKSAREFIGNVLKAHNLGLPKKRTRFCRWRSKRTPNKENGPVGGTGPLQSYASVWGTLWGTMRPPRDG